MQPLPIDRVSGLALSGPGHFFTDGRFDFETTGDQIGAGGMGSVWKLLRRPHGASAAPAELVVGKIYRHEYLIYLRSDDTARRRFQRFESALQRIVDLPHANVLPMLLSARIADNYLYVSPLAGPSLLAHCAATQLSPRERVRLLRDALAGLAALHRHGIVHRDFTVNNVLCVGPSAALFDFDLAIIPHELPPEEHSYLGHYAGAIYGSPDFSIVPEILDGALGLEPISPRADVYAAGTALYALFTDESIYGDCPDLPSLYQRIAEGMVHRGKSRVRYPDDLPHSLRPVIERCMEREPGERYADAAEVVEALAEPLEEMSNGSITRSRARRAVTFDHTVVDSALDRVLRDRPDPSVSEGLIGRVESALARHGYLLERSLGRVKGHAIFLALPDPALVASGRFPEQNTFRKIVTAIDLAARSDGAELVERWLGRIYPVLARVRQGHLTSLHKVAHERVGDLLLLFSEYVDDPRFGTDLSKHDLPLEETLAIGLIVAESIGRLHAEGLAHNNVRPQSLVLQGRRREGRVHPLFVGLVEPSFAPEVFEDDVRNLAAMVLGFVSPGRLDALRPDVRDELKLLLTRLEKTATGELRDPAPTLDETRAVMAEGLSLLDGNFGMLRDGGGDLTAYAELLLRHSLYHRLYALDVSDE